MLLHETDGDGRWRSSNRLLGRFFQEANDTDVEADLYIQANDEESPIGLMRVGQSATIKVDALLRHDLRGRGQLLAGDRGAVRPDSVREGHR